MELQLAVSLGSRKSSTWRLRGGWISGHLAEERLTLEAVARAAGIAPERLRDICSGTFDPELVLVRRIARAVGVPMSTLFAEPDYN